MSHVVEAVTNTPGHWGPGYGEMLAGFADPNARALKANSDGGIIAFGTGHAGLAATGDRTVSIRCNLPNADYGTLASPGGSIKLTCAPDGSGWKAGATVYTPDGTASVLSAELDLNTPYKIDATYDASTGTLILYVDETDPVDTTFGEARETIVGFPSWYCGAPDSGWVTDFAVWSKVLEFATNPTVTIEQGSGQADPGTGSSVVFDVEFSEAVTGFATGDVTLSGTAGATTGTVVDSGDHIHFTVTVTGMTSDGTVVASIGSAVCTSTASGLPNDASTSTDNSVTYTYPAITFIDAGTVSRTWPSDSTVSVGVPGSRQSGDLLLMFIHFVGGQGSGSESGVSSGWTKAGSTGYQQLWWKISDGTETTFSMTKGSWFNGYGGVIVVYRNVHASNPLDYALVNDGGSGFDAVTVDGAGRTLVYWASSESNTAGVGVITNSSSGTLTTRLDYQSTGGSNRPKGMMVADRANQSSSHSSGVTPFTIAGGGTPPRAAVSLNPA